MLLNLNLSLMVMKHKHVVGMVNFGCGCVSAMTKAFHLVGPKRKTHYTATRTSSMVEGSECIFHMT